MSTFGPVEVSEVRTTSLPSVERKLLSELSDRLSGWKDRDFVGELKRTLEHRRQALEEISSCPTPPTFRNTCLPLEMLDLEVDAVLGDFNTLLSSLRHPALLSVEKRISRLASESDKEDMQDNRSALRIRALWKNTRTRHLSASKRRLIKDHYLGFLRSGYYLPTRTRTRLSKLYTKLTDLERAYSRASAKEQKCIQVESRPLLKGLSAREISEFRNLARASKKSGWLIPLEPTQHQPITSSLEEPRLRRLMHKAALARGRRTAPVAREILRLRHKIAVLMGYKDWASCKLSESFARTPQRVWSRLKRIARKAGKSAASDLLAARQRGWSPVSDTSVCPLSYIPSKEDTFRKFDPRAVLERGCFTAALKLFGLRFQKISGIPLFHRDAVTYRVLEGNGKVLGFLTTDLWHRQGKDDGAWASQWITKPGLPAAASIFMNAPRSGCSFSDARTVFHEFGHALHALFSSKQYPSHWGLEMPSDFAEIPSQLAEAWASYPEIYRCFAPSDAPPASSVSPPRPSLGEGLQKTALLVSSATDIMMHSSPTKDLSALDAEAARVLGLKGLQATPRYRASYFEHVFSSGYDASYYSYIWTESEAEALSKWIRVSGGLSAKVGRALRKHLMAPGGALNTESLSARFKL